ncbi:hypothetical protein FJTKL_14246 [Diaporthe vaccinii]|uniref:Uncharacterized protein n=1 Tax=Diaporthe vaccinii TaxID=105482 RepID=A0ABR4E8F6_9PEZI
MSFLIPCGGTKVEHAGRWQYVLFGVSISTFLARDVLPAASSGKQGFVGEGHREKLLETTATPLVPTRESCKIVERKAIGADQA